MALLATFSQLLLPSSIVALIFWFCKKLIQRRNQPPGPFGLPILGFVPSLTEKEMKHVMFDRLSKIYGPIFQFQSGQNNVVVLNSAQSMKDAFKMAEFSYRPETMMGRVMIEGGEKNITFANGERWRFCRKLANRALPVFTVAKHSRLEPTLYATGDWLCTKVLSECANGQSVVIKQHLMAFTGSLMSSILFGSPPEPEGQFVQWLGEYGEDILAEIQKVWLVDIFPSLAFLFQSNQDRMCAIMTKFVLNVRRLMHEHEYTGDVATVSDSIVKACEELPEEEKAHMNMTDSEIGDTVLDLFDAGFFTTAENLEWLFLLMATHTEIQAKVQQEIDSLITEPGKPSIKDDLPNMVYCRATVHELIRWTSNMPIGLAHTCLEDVSFAGFVIPKGSLIQPNQYAINHDPELFTDPDKFCPERFVAADGTFNQQESEKIVSFSNGKRRCPGEQLAKQDIFLTMAYMLGRLDVQLDMTSFEKNPLLGDGNGVTFYPGEHRLFFTERRSNKIHCEK